MIWPCPHKVDCVGSDYPLMNVSSEGPDMPQFTAVGFCCNGQQAWSYSLASQVDAEDQLQRLMFLGCPDCADENSYCADANCPDGTFLARYCLPTSQAEADTLANLHEAAMAPYCDGQLGDLFSATCSCPDGSQSMTAYSEISDADALNACQSVPRDCNDTPATNTQQICFSRCPDGTLFYWVVAAGTFYASTVAEANAMAYAVACQRAQIFRVCISGAVPRACLNSAYNIILTATSGRTYSWNVSGTLPPGLTATPIGQNGLQIQGTPTTPGTYTLVLTATDDVGNYMTKVIVIVVWGIVQTSLPDGVFAADYDQQLTSVGGTAPYTYTLVSGGFPLGVDITSSGLITGVVGEEGVFSPMIRVRDNLGRTCTKQFTLTVPANIPTVCAYFTLDEVAGNRFDSVSNLEWTYDDDPGTGNGWLGSTPGIYSNAVRVYTAVAGSAIPQLFSINQAQLATTGNGWSMCGWFKRVSTDVGGVSLTWRNDFPTGYWTITLLFNAGLNQVRILDADVVSQTLSFAATSGDWHFFHIFFSTIDQRVYFQLDDGPATNITNPSNVPSGDTGDIYLQGSDNCSEILFDEIAFKCDAQLTADEVTYLYNGGDGKTWPLT